MARVEDVIQRKDGFRSRRFVFGSRDSFPVVADIARTSGWKQLLKRPTDQPRADMMSVRWEVDAEIDPGLRITFTEDAAIDSAYVLATSPLGPPQRVKTVTRVFAAYWGVLSFDDLIVEVDTATADALPLAVLRAGLGAPAHRDERFVERISACAAAEEDSVREAALWAMTYAEWPVFRPVLREVAAGDPDEFLRKMASGVLSSYDRIGLPE
ncbi:hypothetical protein SAMN05421805_103522 [Saccharopolyspora antimicrobica]|uniref:HEAT repeat-containing protein n=1 Tax=Saccharopolyspora antimicrobica TaxID=455193 RepID=A0A1I4XNM0_9PSEU|nr:hypothetical protein [Saccharopolyspora antimicrobica]RKT84586.1 hypothetical protein ATL45_2907 [Saccharopolyspora antimicrobica]SFN27407.1 hypothetical protein SAMN05421805_103522 [Saccharopolyspora antimicrobica]